MNKFLILCVALCPAAVWADTMTFTTSGCSQSNPASATCVCPAGCTAGATCTTSGVVSCDSDITINSGATLQASAWVAGSTATTFSVTGKLTNGSTTIASVLSTVGLAAGQVVTGTSIPLGATITSVSGSSFTISAAVTATVASESIGVVAAGFLTLSSGGNILLNGTLSANTSGYSGSASIINNGVPGGCPSLNGVGQGGNGYGPGYGSGGECVRDGGGGGAYGGAGGNGSGDLSCSTEQGAGGIAYDPDPNSVTLGSGAGAAGSGDNDSGGTGPSGGGALLLYATNITINGIVTSNGGNGILVNDDAQGGGAGGGILLNATNDITCNASGMLSVQGGNGAAIDDKGGAGGGGRIKTVAKFATLSCTIDLAAGSFGCSAGDGSAAGAIGGSLLGTPSIDQLDGTPLLNCSFSADASPTFSGTIPAGACSAGTPQVTISVDSTVIGTTSNVNCVPTTPTWSFQPTISITGTVTSGSATVSNVSNTAQLVVGQPIAGTGILAGTTITAFSPNTITLSQNANATSAGNEALTVTYVFSGGVHTIRAYAQVGEATSAPFNVSGNLTNGSMVITGVTDTGQLVKGESISGAGLAATTITSINAIPLSVTTKNGSDLVTGVADTTGLAVNANIVATGVASTTVISSVGQSMAATTTGASKNVTVLNTGCLSVGDAVTGANIPAGTTIGSITSTTVFRLSANATASGATTVTDSALATTSLCLNTVATATGTVTATVSNISNTIVVAVAATATTAADLLSVTPVTITGTLSSGSTSVTSVSSVAGLVAGQTVFGANIPSNTTIVSVGASSFVMSNAATGSPGTESITINDGETQQSSAATVNVYFDTFSISSRTPAAAALNSAITKVTGASTDNASSDTVALSFKINASTTNISPAVAVSGGAWSDTLSYTPSAGNQGTVTITATQSMAADATCTSGYTATATTTYVYDSVAPVLTVVPPAFTSSLTTVALSGTYSDATSGVNTATMSAVICASDCTSSCATAVTPAAAAGSYTASPSVASFSDGSTVCAKVSATDTAGNTAGASDPATKTFVIDRTKPTLTLNGSAAPLQTVAQENGNASGTASDTNLKNVVVSYCSTPSGAACTAGTTVCGVAATAPVSFTPGTTFTTSPALADGKYCVIATATDNANNTTTLDEALTVDTGAPALTSFSVLPPLANSVPSTVTISGTYTDAGSGVDPTSVTLKVCGSDCTSSCVPVATVASTGTGFSATPNGTSVYTFIAGIPQDGTYCAVVNFKDKAGNPQSGTKTFVLDTTPPSLGVAINSPTNTVAVTGTYSDAGTGLSGPPQLSRCDADCTSHCGGGFTCVEPGGSSPQSGTCAAVLPPPGSDGMYCIRETATDVAGNLAVTTQPFLFVATPPAVTLNGAPQVLQNVPTASGNVGNVTPGDAVTVDVTYCMLGATDVCNAAFIAACPTPVPFDSGPLALDASNNFSATPTLPDGSYCVQADATDAAGNTKSVQETLTLDTETPALVITGAPNLVQKTSVVTGSVLNVLAGDPVSVDLVYCLLGAGDVCSAGFMTGCTPASDSGALPLDPSSNFTNAPGPALADGDYCVQGTGTDAALNEIAETVTLTIDTTAPVVTLNGGPALTQPGGTVTGTATDPDSASVDVQYCTLSSGQTCADLVTCTVAYDSGALVPDGSNAFSATPAPALADGTYCVQATATDGLGNSSETQITLVQAPGGGATGGGSGGASGGATSGGATGGATGGTNSDGGSTSGTSADSGSTSGSSADSGSNSGSDSGSTSGSSAGSNGGAIGSSAGATSGATGGLTNNENDMRLVGGGCSCHSTPSSGDLWLGAILAVFLWRRRRAT